MLSDSILLLAALAANPDLQGPVLRADTTKPLSVFGSCFVAAQEQASRPWSFVPNGRGGVFSDAGAHGTTAPYRLQVREDRRSNEILLFAAAGSDQVVGAVERCR